MSASPDYLTQPGDLLFVPDPTKVSGLPASAIMFDETRDICRYMGKGAASDTEYILSDVGSGWLVGTADELDNKDAIFGEYEFAPVKATLTNIKFSGDRNIDMPVMSAQIVNIEPIGQ